MMTILNKTLLGSPEKEGIFDFPCTMLLIQSILSIIVLKILDLFKLTALRPLETSALLTWLPLNAFFITMLISSNWSLEILSVPVVTIWKNICTCLVALGDFYFFHKPLGLGTASSLVIMTVGAIGASLNDLKFDFNGYFWVILNCVVGAIYVLYTRHVTQTLKMASFDSMYFNCVLSIPFIILFLMVTGEINKLMVFDSSSVSNELVIVVCLNACFAFGISFCSYWVIRVTSPTTFSILGSTCKVPLYLFSMWWFEVEIGIQQQLASWTALIGGIIYAVAQTRSHQPEPREIPGKNV